MGSCSEWRRSSCSATSRASSASVSPGLTSCLKRVSVSGASWLLQCSVKVDFSHRAETRFLFRGCLAFHRSDGPRSFTYSSSERSCWSDERPRTPDALRALFLQQTEETEGLDASVHCL
ncbi:hypothetical protein MHYP_G00225920 [Metynnis hypsauchen]